MIVWLELQKRKGWWRLGRRERWMLLGPRSRGLHIWLLKGKHSGSWSGLELSKGMPCRGIGRFDSVDLRVSWRFATPQRAQGTHGTCSPGSCPLPFPLRFLPAKALCPDLLDGRCWVRAGRMLWAGKWDALVSGKAEMEPTWLARSALQGPQGPYILLTKSHDEHLVSAQPKDKGS